VEAYDEGGNTPGAESEDSGDPATSKQIGMVNGLFTKLGLKGDERFDWLAFNMDIRLKSTKELTKRQASDVITLLQEKIEVKGE